MSVSPLQSSWAIAILRASPVPWWVVGGCALSVHLGRSWRAHADLDVAVREADAPRLRRHVAEHARHAGGSEPPATWPSDTFITPASILLRSPVAEELDLEITLSAGDDTCWAYRRDPTIRLPWTQAVLIGAWDIPYLAPELVLLGKSRSRRPHDDADAHHVIPCLEPHRRAWLAERLAHDHPWHAALCSAPD